MNFREGFFFFFFSFDSFPRELARFRLVPWQYGFPADKLFKARAGWAAGSACDVLAPASGADGRGSGFTACLQNSPEGGLGLRETQSKSSVFLNLPLDDRLELFAYKWERSRRMQHLPSKN